MWASSPLETRRVGAALVLARLSTAILQRDEREREIAPSASRLITSAGSPSASVEKTCTYKCGDAEGWPAAGVGYRESAPLTLSALAMSLAHDPTDRPHRFFLRGRPTMTPPSTASERDFGKKGRSRRRSPGCVAWCASVLTVPQRNVPGDRATLWHFRRSPLLIANRYVA